MTNINNILNKEIENVNPYPEVIKEINRISKYFLIELNKKLKTNKIKASVFIGGSLAKDTLIKKPKYDIDIFVRFDKIYKNKDISKILGGILKNAKKVHGSRDYYQIESGDLTLEIIPVIKVNDPKEAENIIDLSYFHVEYIKKKTNKNILDQIKIAKKFTESCNCYGAESYIHGFSGYSLELLIIYYKSFLNFIKEIAKLKEEKIIIDIEKNYKNKNNILIELNEAKIQSPIILIDPTFKDRNVLAGLNKETLEKFRKICQEFLKRPSKDFFIKKNVFDELNKKHKDKLRVISLKTTRQAGDIAGTKSKKFFNFFKKNLEKEFLFNESEFFYNKEKNIAYFYLVINKKEQETIKGPKITDIENLKRFKKTHKNAFIKEHFAYTKINHNLNLEQFIKIFLKKHKNVVKSMDIKEMKLVR
jgi:tRNA nucleotidyltransferase (CCA-adding enzyme)